MNTVWACRCLRTFRARQEVIPLLGYDSWFQLLQCVHCFQWTVLYINLVHHVSRLLRTCQTVRDTYTGQTSYSFYLEESFFASCSELSWRVDEGIAIDGFWPFLRWLDFAFNCLFLFTLQFLLNGGVLNAQIIKYLVAKGLSSVHLKSFLPVSYIHIHYVKEYSCCP